MGTAVLRHGALYWYYYAVEPNDAEAEGSRMTRIRAAAPWMRDAAGDRNVRRDGARRIYAGIAEFNVRIVP